MLSVFAGDDPDELEVYGTDTVTGPMVTSYKFEVPNLSAPNVQCTCRGYMYVQCIYMYMYLYVCMMYMYMYTYTVHLHVHVCATVKAQPLSGM